MTKTGKNIGGPDERSHRPPTPPGHFDLTLYVTGTTPASVRAISNIRSYCEHLLKGKYTLEVVDIYQHPAMARDEQIIAAPTLIKHEPKPLRRLVGDFSIRDRVTAGLGIG
jgi:circadian clock protein KaiB